MGSEESLDGSLRRLVYGLTDQEIAKGKYFYYGNQSLYGGEVAEAMLPSLLCVSQFLAKRLEIADWGFEFQLGGMVRQEDGPNFFALHYFRDPDAPKLCFMEVAPFITEVFEKEFLEYSNEVARFFERAAQLVNPEFSLDENTDYRQMIGEQNPEVGVEGGLSDSDLVSMMGGSNWMQQLEAMLGVDEQSVSQNNHNE